MLICGNLYQKNFFNSTFRFDQWKFEPVESTDKTYKEKIQALGP